MAIGFNTFGADPIGSFADGFTGMDTYLRKRRSDMRDQRVKDQTDIERQTFAASYMEAQKDPTKRAAFYKNYPRLAAGMIGAQSKLSGGAAGGIFGSGSAGGIPNVVGTVSTIGNGTAAVPVVQKSFRRPDGTIETVNIPANSGQSFPSDPLAAPDITPLPGTTPPPGPLATSFPSDPLSAPDITPAFTGPLEYRGRGGPPINPPGLSALAPQAAVYDPITGQLSYGGSSIPAIAPLSYGPGALPPGQSTGSNPVRFVPGTSPQPYNNATAGISPTYLGAPGRALSAVGNYIAGVVTPDPQVFDPISGLPIIGGVR